MHAAEVRNTTSGEGKAMQMKGPKGGSLAPGLKSNFGATVAIKRYGTAALVERFFDLFH